MDQYQARILYDGGVYHVAVETDAVFKAARAAFETAPLPHRDVEAKVHVVRMDLYICEEILKRAAECRLRREFYRYLAAQARLLRRYNREFSRWVYLASAPEARAFLRRVRDYKETIRRHDHDASGVFFVWYADHGPAVVPYEEEARV